MDNPRIIEIFPSMQGEGIYVGEPQIFIRFAECNLACNFCDTKKSGGRGYELFELLDFVNRLNFTNIFDTISITGGEPLLHVDFLKTILPQLKKRNFRIYLETNGTLPENLEEISNFVDIIAMDMKLPSAQKKKKCFWTEHRAFLNIANKKEVFVKIVITDNTRPEEIQKAVSIIDDISSEIPLVLQPVTPANKIKKRVSLDKLLNFQRMAKMVLEDVRVIPQVHKILRAR